MPDNLWNTPHLPQIEQDKLYPSPTILHTNTIMRDALFERFKTKICHNPALDRTLVSFQGNKQVPFYSWFKYKEGFSQQLVSYLLQNLMPQAGTLLDPFAGAGSALFAANELGWITQGIEVLPVGVYAIKARIAATQVNAELFRQLVAQTLTVNFEEHYDELFAFNHIAITKGAYPKDEEKKLIGYIAYCNRHIEEEHARNLFLYAAFCILEDMSYTRKDGQYLRWDIRSGRSQGKKPFDKGNILSFQRAIEIKLRQISTDLLGSLKQRSFFDAEVQTIANDAQNISIFSDSCLELLPKMPSNAVNFVLTSPPYANRYDYTRTYALELVYLGSTEQEVKNLRQAMLSCTVENKNKRDQIKQIYTDLEHKADFIKVDEVFNRQAALQEVLTILNIYRSQGKLNNPHIVRLVHNYFYEMAFVIYELARILKPGGIVAMVNDNVRYAGEEIPVDLILSDMAEMFGLTTRVIWTLGRGKGNSSQQMGSHGRTELRKCVYIWEK